LGERRGESGVAATELGHGVLNVMAPELDARVVGGQVQDAVGYEHRAAADVEYARTLQHDTLGDIVQSHRVQVV